MDVKLTILVLASFLTLSLAVQKKCPTKCRCSKNFKTVNCERRKLRQIPTDIPNTATELYLGYNYLTSIPANIFQHLSSLTVLSLKNNMLLSDSIHQEAFSGLHQLQRLFLTGNKLTNMSRELFKDTENLQRLYFSQNKLTSIPDLGLCKSLIRLGIDNNQLTSATFPPGFDNLFKLSTVVLSNNQITNFTLTDVKHLQNSDIRKIDLSRCMLQTVDTLAFTQFSHLQSLVLSYNVNLKMSSISNIIKSLGHSQLSSLDLSHSVQDRLPPNLFASLAAVPLLTLSLSHMKNADVIENGTFSNLPHLQKLDLSNSMLTIVESGAFDPNTSQLKQLNLGSNDLKFLPEKLPRTLQILDISNNGAITDIDKTAFFGLHKLQNLTLKNCRIRVVDNDAFIGTSGLLHLDLSHNVLSGTSLGLNVLKPLVNLKELSLRGNKMTQIQTEEKLFQSQGTLRTLDMSDNNCGVLPALIFNPLKSLQMLNLSGNNLDKNIADDDGKFFSGLGKLEILDIHNSGIHALPRDLLTGTRNLGRLLLSQNKISLWEPGIFNKTRQLSLVDLSNNSIAIINSTSVQGLTDGVRLDLSGNPFNCWCDLSWFRKWMDEVKNSSTVVLVGADTYTCLSPENMHNKKVLSFRPEAIHSQCFPPPWLYYVIGAAAGASAVFLISFSVMYRYRWPLRLKWYYFKKSWACFRRRRDGYDPLEGNDTDMEYDVLVSYGPSDTDQQWVKNTLIPYLKDFNVFFEEKDAMPNESTIGQIAQSIWSSRKILLVVSKEYLRDSRRDYEVKLALSSIEERELLVSETIILVLLEPTAGVSVPAVLHPLMDKHKELIWTEDQSAQALFWNTLDERIRAQPGSQQNIQL